MATHRNGASPQPRIVGSAATRARRFARLLMPGVGVKRWLLAGAFGVAISSIGVAFMIRRIFEPIYFPDFLPWHFEGLLLLAVGGGAILLSMYGFYRKFSALAPTPRSIDTLAENVYTRWHRGRGPKVVAIGGGTGQSVLLRGLKTHTHNLTAVITVADDGGSSGRLRRELGVLPPGDFRNCLVALSDDESPLTDLFQYRFDEGEGLEGHSFGNLFIVAMTDITNSFDEALVESSRVLAVHGDLAPSTSADLRLAARFSDGAVVRGESSIRKHDGRVERLTIEPANAKAHPLAVEAIEDADLVVIGPGSLYTSILPNVLVKGIADALERASAPVVYVCNVSTEKGETEGYTARAHVESLQRHTSAKIVDYALANNGLPYSGENYGNELVRHDGEDIPGVEVALADVIDVHNPIRHDSRKLADALMSIHDAASNGEYASVSAADVRV